MRESKQGLNKLGWVFAVAVATMLGGVSAVAQSADPVCSGSTGSAAGCVEAGG